MSSQRCFKCRDPISHCICETLVPVDTTTRVELVLPAREVKKCATTGPFALAALSRARLHLQGQRNAPLAFGSLHEEGRRVVVLYPGERASILDRDFVTSDPRPITLVVPDGTFRQAGQVVRRVPGLAGVTQVKLDTPPRGTFEALARALGVIESPAVERELLEMFARSQLRRHQEQQTTMRGAHGPSRTHDSAGPPPLAIVFEDESFVAVNKPSGTPVHRGLAKDGTPALQILRDQIGQHVFPVHRLDRATSGALLFAKNPDVARDLKRLFDERRVQKRYLTLCRGHQFQTLRVSHALSSGKDKPRVPAVTDIRLLGSFERYGLFEAYPHSGRLHQIRKHLKHVSHPIIGDVRYGKGEHNRYFRDRFGFSRLALHCERVLFPHPRSGAPVSIHAPLA